MRTPLVLPPNPHPLTPEQYAKKLGVSRKRYLELKAIADKALAEVAGKRAAEMGLTIPEYLKYLNTNPDSNAVTPGSKAAVSTAVKTKRTAKVSTRGRKQQASKTN